MRLGLYKLEGHIPKRVYDVLEWARWFEKEDRLVAATMINDVKVSTIFLGLDHGYNGEPIFFETMVFGGKHDQWQERCQSWDEAELVHKRACQMVKDVMPKEISRKSVGRNE